MSHVVLGSEMMRRLDELFDVIGKDCTNMRLDFPCDGIATVTITRFITKVEAAEVVKILTAHNAGAEDLPDKDADNG